MSSCKSSSSKSIFDPEAMLDVEDLDYEPDGVDHDDQSDDDDEDSEIRDYNKNNHGYARKFSEINQNNRENEDYSQKENYRIHYAEPSGQEDQENSSNQASSDRLSYGTDLEKAPSVTSSYRDKINYNHLHVDVEKDSYRSKFGKYSDVTESVYLDSSDDEEQETEDFEVEVGQEDTGSHQNTYTLSESPSDENSYSLERNLVDPESLGDPESRSFYHQNSYESSEGSQTSEDSSEANQTSENMSSPEDIWKRSPRSDATTTKVDNSAGSDNLSDRTLNNISNYNNIQKNNALDNTPVVGQARKGTSLNFSIQVVGRERICLLPKVTKIRKKSQKPWVSTVREYLDSQIIKLTSQDEVISFIPETSFKPDIKSRLDLSPRRSRLDGSSLDSQTSGSETGFSFKVPIKRPPTRLKLASKNLSVSVDLKSKQKTVTSVGTLAPLCLGTLNQEDNQDDIISLIASSCQLSTVDELENMRDLTNNNAFIKDEPLSVAESSNGTERAKIERTAQWVSSTESKIAKPFVPGIYRGLCFSYFFSNRCTNHLCTRSHFLVGPQTHIKRLQYLNIEELMEAYNFAKEHPFFYGQIYKYFSEAFAVHGKKEELINMVHIIFEESFHKIDPEEGLDHVLNALQKANLNTFEDAVEYLLLQIGLKHYPGLGNILFEIICKKTEVAHHWPIIRKLVITGEKMTDGLGSRFLVHLMKDPVDFKVCQEVYRHILKYKFIDLPKISLHIRGPFLKICSENNLRDDELQATIERNLTKERFNFERTMQNNTNIQNLAGSSNNQVLMPDFSVPPPISFGRTSSQSSDNSNVLNYIPPVQFGSGLSHGSDFASLSRQASSSHSINFSNPPPSFGNVPRVSNSTDERRIEKNSQSSGSHHDVNYTYRLPETRKNLCDYESSEDGNSKIEARFSDSDEFEHNSGRIYSPLPNSGSGTRKRPAFTGRMYNREGLQYDPANDYFPPHKKQGEMRSICDRFQEGSRLGSDQEHNQMMRSSLQQPFELNNSEFDRLNQGTSEWVQQTNRHFQASRVPFDRPPPCGDEDWRPAFTAPNRNNDLVSDSYIHNVNSTNREDVSTSWRQFGIRNNETAVSSSSDAKLRDEKVCPPETPKFGEMYFDPNYEFNVSLHNLYLQAIDNVDIDEDDVHKLNDCVKSADGRMFLQLIEKYKGPKTVQNFIAMTLAHLKGMNQLMAKTYQGLLDTLEEENPYYYKNRYIRVILEVITMNLLFDLQQRNMSEAATTFLLKFSDWDSLVTSRLFISKGVSIIGRYLFIAKILVTCRPELTYEILVFPGLHLLEKYEVWPYYPPCPIPEIFSADLEVRNSVIVKFLKTGYLLNTVVVIQLYKTAFRKKIWDLDVRPYVNPMVINMINKNLIIPLKQINNEMNLFCKFLSKDALRAFLITMYKHLNEKDIFTLYEMCVDKKIYQKFVKGENIEYKIEVKTNMHPCEIKLIINYYFMKLTEIKKVPPGSDSLTFEIILPGELCLKALPMLNINKSLVTTKEILIHLLKQECSLEVNSVFPNIVEVEKEQLVNYLDRIWT